MFSCCWKPCIFHQNFLCIVLNLTRGPGYLILLRLSQTKDWNFSVLLKIILGRHKSPYRDIFSRFKWSIFINRKCRHFFWKNFSISPSHKPFLGSCEWPQKIGLDWPSRLDGHWILTNRQTSNEQKLHVYRGSLKMGWIVQRIWVFATNLNFPFSLSLQPGGVNLWYFKLRLHDLTEFLVWNI